MKMKEPCLFLQRLGVIVFVVMLCLAQISCSKMGESEIPSSGGADEVPSSGGADEVPPSGGADEVPSSGGADEVPPSGGADEVPPSDIIAPSPITGLIAVNAYDGRVNLWWDKNTAEDFDYYNIYVSESEIWDDTDIVHIYQVNNISTTNYQVTGLKNGTEYYFAITAVDKNGNEDKQVSSLTMTPVLMPGGTEVPDFHVDVYQSDMVWAGTTLLRDHHNPERPRIIEINMLGEIVWEYILPQNLQQYTNPGFDVEPLSNGNILFALPRKGVYEINRDGKTVWSYLTGKISHDADRLPNGNTIFAFGAYDGKSDAQVTEINQKGEIIWSWHAKDYFDKPPYQNVSIEGWTHTNAVTRLSNGNTLISPRNFHVVVEVDPQGAVVRLIGEGILKAQHDPEILANGNMLLANHGKPHRAIEIDSETGNIVWQSRGFPKKADPVRDANRLPNGNTLITGTTEIVEVTQELEVVWKLVLNKLMDEANVRARGFYKAERISKQRQMSGTP
jgi:hypothetical protein